MKTALVNSRIGILTGIIFTICAMNLHSQNPQHVYTGTGGTIGNVGPFGTTGNTRKMWVFTPSNFTPSAPAGYITAIYFRVNASPTSSTFTNLLIQMGATTLSSFTAGPYPTTIDTVFFATSHTVNIISSGPWMKITFQTPFYFNGTSNFLVDARQGGYTSGITLQQQTVTGTCLFGPASTPTASLTDRLVEFGFDLIPGGTDAGLEGFVSPPDTVCAGSLPVTVTLKNFGPNALSGASLHWTLNNIPQPAYNWTGNLAVNATTNVTVGSGTFAQGANNSVKVWVNNPNNVPDTVHSNDTVFKPEVFGRPAPQLSLNDTTLQICQGDTATIVGLLTGTPPWTLILNDGSTNTTFSNVLTPAFTTHVFPSSSKTYTFTSVADATGCMNTAGPKVVVNVHPAPTATITPVGTTAACDGDSVSLMATVGLNFTYQWYKNGVAVNDMTGYVAHIKSGGAYTVKVISPFGCAGVSAPVSVVIHTLPAVFLGNDTTVAPGASVPLNAGPGFNTYLWSTGATAQMISVDTNGYGTGVRTIWVEIRDNNYCKGSDTIKINFTSNPGIDNAHQLMAVKVVPNPTSGRFDLHLQNLMSDEFFLEIFSTDGRLLFRQMIVNHAYNTIIGIDPGYLPVGIYHLKICNPRGEFISMAKLVVDN